jgi:hypothetical protein
MQCYIVPAPKIRGHANLLKIASIKPFVVAFLVFLLVCQILILISGAPLALSGQGDFPALYRAGRMIWSGERLHLYDPAAQERFDRAMFPGRETATNYFYHPPAELLLLGPLALLSYKAAYFLWAVLSTGLLLFSARILQPQLGKLREAIDIPIPILFLAYFPVAMTLSLGQDSIVLLAVIVAACLQFLRKRDVACGAILGLGLFKFQHIIPLIAILAVRKRPKLLAGFAATTVAFLAVSWVIVGTSGLISYWHILWRLNPEMGWEMTNIRGIVESFGGFRAYTLGISACIFLWCALKRFPNDAIDYSAALIGTSLVSYHMHAYDLTILLVAFMFALEYSIVERKWLGIALVAILFLTPLQFLLWHLKMIYLFALPLLALLIFLSLQRPSQFPQPIE